LRLSPPLNLPAPGRRQCVYGALRGLARTCVFAKQSLGPIHCDPGPRLTRSELQPRASLLPKLRDQYAEFLDHVSLVHLRLLASPTCVGLRYGRLPTPHAAFLARRLNRSRGSAEASSLPISSRDLLKVPTALDGQSTRPLLRRFGVPGGSTLKDGAGMSTGCPSATPLGPRLRVRLTLR
jgi:hypothetical protein